MCRLDQDPEVDAFSWLLELNPFKLSEYKRYFVARNGEGNVVGFFPAARFPLVRAGTWKTSSAAPEGERGISELLVVEALKHLAAEGAELATLATSPLAGVKDASGIQGHYSNPAFDLRAFRCFLSLQAPAPLQGEVCSIIQRCRVSRLYPPKVRPRMIRAAINVIEPGGLTGMAASKLPEGS